MDEVEGLKNKTNGTESRGSSAKERQERIVQLKEREKSERLKKLEELKEHALQAARLREEQDSRRRKHFEELGRKDEERRKQCEERRRMLDEERRLAFASKYEAKKSAVKIDRKPGFAFGSCTPRQLDNQDGFLWKSQYALNVSSESGTTRAASASDLRQTGELRIFCGRRKTDLTPTLPIRTIESGRCSSRTSGRVSSSMSKLDRERSPLTRSKSTTHLRLTRTEKLRQALAKGSPGATTPMSRPPSSMSSLMTSSTHSQLRPRNLGGGRKARPTSVHITGVSTETQRPSPPPKVPDGPRWSGNSGNPLSPTSGMSRSFSGKSLGKQLQQTAGQQAKSRPHSANTPAVAPVPPTNNLSSSSSSNSNLISSARGNKEKKPAKMPEPPQPKKQVPAKKVEAKETKVETKGETKGDIKVKSNVKESIETKEAKVEERDAASENELIVISSLHDDPPPLEVKMEKVEEIQREPETKEESFDSKEGPETLVDFDSPPPPEEGNVGATELADSFNFEVNGSKVENNTSIESETEGAKKLLTEEDAKAALAEKRRLAREAHEKEMARLEAERLAEEQRQREEEENAERIIREAKKMEEERLRLAIEEQQKKEAQEKLRKEEEEAQRIEREREEAAAAREAERIRLEMEERLRREEEERLERRRRVEAIMSRTRKKEDIRNEGGQENLQVNEEDPPATATFNNAYNNNNTEFLINFDGSGGTIESSLATPPSTNHITSIQAAVIIEALASMESMSTALGRRMAELSRSIQERFEIVSRTQNGFLESCHRIQEGVPMIEEKIGEVLDKILDSFVNNTRLSEERLKSLTSLVEAGCPSPYFPPETEQTTTEETTVSPNVLDSLTDKEIEELSQSDYHLGNFTEEEKKQLWKRLFPVPEE